jgi:hypothetical protein
MKNENFGERYSHYSWPNLKTVSYSHSKMALTPATTTRARSGRPSECAINLGGHDKVVLMQSRDFLGLQRDRRIAPTEADIRMMAFGFGEFANLLNKGKRLPEIAKPEAPLDAVRFLRQLPRGPVRERARLARA